MSTFNEAFIRFCGYKYYVKVTAIYKVRMEHSDDDDKQIDFAYLATDRIFDNNSDVNVEAVNVEYIETENGSDIATVEAELTVSVVEHDYEDAFSEAENVVREEELPVGVSLYNAEAYDYETYGEESYQIVGE